MKTSNMAEMEIRNMKMEIRNMKMRWDLNFLPISQGHVWDLFMDVTTSVFHTDPMRSLYALPSSSHLEVFVTKACC